MRFAFFIIIIACIVPVLMGTAFSKEKATKVIYGNDNRTLVDKHNPKLLQRFLGSVALMTSYAAINRDQAVFKKSRGKISTLSAFRNGDFNNLCSGERFFDTPVVPGCTAFLVAPDVVLTAGHCAPSNNDDICKFVQRFIFDFQKGKVKWRDADRTVRVKSNTIYACKKVLSFARDKKLGLDYALIQLDREVKGRTPFNVRRYGKVGTYDELGVLGHPSGLLLMIADNAFVRSNEHNNFFKINSDTSQGNSGSPVINFRTLEVEGVLARGEGDFVPDPAQLALSKKDPKTKVCLREYKCKANECEGEDVTRASVIEGLHIYIDESFSRYNR